MKVVLLALLPLVALLFDSSHCLIERQIIAVFEEAAKVGKENEQTLKNLVKDHAMKERQEQELARFYWNKGIETLNSVKQKIRRASKKCLGEATDDWKYPFDERKNAIEAFIDLHKNDAKGESALVKEVRPKLAKCREEKRLLDKCEAELKGLDEALRRAQNEMAAAETRRAELAIEIKETEERIENCRRMKELVRVISELLVILKIGQGMGEKGRQMLGRMAEICSGEGVVVEVYPNAEPRDRYLYIGPNLAFLNGANEQDAPLRRVYEYTLALHKRIVDGMEVEE